MYENIRVTSPLGGQVWYLIVSITEYSPKIYNRRDDAYFKIVIFLFQRGYVIHPHSGIQFVAYSFCKRMFKYKWLQQSIEATLTLSWI